MRKIFSTLNEEQSSDDYLDLDLEDDNDQRDNNRVLLVYS